jgi:hypothetical protein
MKVPTVLEEEQALIKVQRRQYQRLILNLELLATRIEVIITEAAATKQLVVATYEIKAFKFLPTVTAFREVLGDSKH